MPAEKRADKIGTNVTHPRDDQGEEDVKKAVPFIPMAGRAQIRQTGEGDGDQHRQEKNERSPFHRERVVIPHLNDRQQNNETQYHHGRGHGTQHNEKRRQQCKKHRRGFEPAVVDHLGNDKDLIHRDRADTGHSNIENQRGKQQQDNQRQRRPDNSRQDS